MSIETSFSVFSALVLNYCKSPYVQVSVCVSVSFSVFVFVLISVSFCLDIKKIEAVETARRKLGS